MAFFLISLDRQKLCKMNYRLKKVAVLGSGIMGSGIACHLANVGMEVVMLDIVTPDLNDEKSKSTVERNKLVNSALQKTIKSKPDPLYHKSFSSRIKTGNFEDDFDKISQLFLDLINNKKIDVIISTGGTGLTGRDITPEVMKTLFDKTIDGFGEMFRWLSYSKIGTSALQSRALAGVSNGTYIFCLPRSPSSSRPRCFQFFLHNHMRLHALVLLLSIRLLQNRYNLHFRH